MREAIIYLSQGLELLIYNSYTKFVPISIIETHVVRTNIMKQRKKTIDKMYF